MPSVNLYQMPQVVQLTETGAVSVSTVVNRTDFNLFKNVANEVEFLIKTVDRKPVNLTSKSLTIYVVNDATNQVVIQETLNVLSSTEDARGHQRLVLDAARLGDLNPGYYRYVITITDLDGVPKIIYTDQNRSVHGYCEVFEGPLPTPQPIIQIEADDFVSDRWGVNLDTYFVAQSYPGAAQRDNKSGMHTLAVYTDNWSGHFWVEASLENSTPQVPSDWFPVTDIELTQQSGVKSIQFTGNYMWLRFYYQPAINNIGNIVKALLKN